MCDPIWHVSSRSGVATLRTAIHLLLTYFTELWRGLCSLRSARLRITWSTQWVVRARGTTSHWRCCTCSCATWTESTPTSRQPCSSTTRLAPSLQNILRQSYDYLTIMPKLRSTYDGRLIYNTHPTKRARLFLPMIHLQSCKIV